MSLCLPLWLYSCMVTLPRCLTWWLAGCVRSLIPCRLEQQWTHSFLVSWWMSEKVQIHACLSSGYNVPMARFLDFHYLQNSYSNEQYLDSIIYLYYRVAYFMFCSTQWRILSGMTAHRKNHTTWTSPWGKSSARRTRKLQTASKRSSRLCDT